YSRRLAVPQQRGAQRAVVQRGYGLFLQSGCGSCHMPTLITGDDPRAPDLSGQTFHPFTDLLLHDMGEGLADGRPD
ncbi:MAG: thiol oxidoreductase, partial [Planctomycetales bacterium]|nr:thiol oxidoreductase [Planctomycetales bacterium]